MVYTMGGGGARGGDLLVFFGELGMDMAAATTTQLLLSWKSTTSPKKKKKNDCNLRWTVPISEIIITILMALMSMCRQLVTCAGVLLDLEMLPSDLCGGKRYGR